MRKIIPHLLMFITLLVCSCNNKNIKITGCWEATFSDPSNNPIQYMDFRKVRNRWELSLDEPDEDWYSIPGEKLYFHDDSLYFEKWWGMEKYYGRFNAEGTVFNGTKELINKPLISFNLKRIPTDQLSYRIPRTDISGKRIYKYQYNKPTENDSFLECSTLSEVGIDSVLIVKLIDKILSGEISNIHSILILKDNKLVLEEYFHIYSKDRLHHIHSVTKSFTSALIGIAIDKKLIKDLDETAGQYFTNRDSLKWIKNKYDIQIQHLLSMSAGLDWKGLTLNESNDDMEMYRSKDYFGYLLDKDLRFTPGTNFCYNNGLSLMLGHIIEKSSGSSVDSFAKGNLFNELEITNYFWDIDDNGMSRTEGGLKMRSLDMLKFGLLYLNEGTWKGKQLISESWIKNSTEQKIFLNDRGYSYHWWTKDYSINSTLFRTYFGLGHGEQAIIIVPDYNLVFVMTAGNYMQPEQKPFEIMTDYVLPSLKIGKTVIQKDLTDFIGEYQINQTESIIIELRDSSLYAVDPVGVTFKLIRKSNFCFTIENQPREIQFVTDNTGKIILGEIFANGQRVEELKKI